MLVLTNLYAAPVDSLGEVVAGLVDPSSKRPAPTPIAETDPALAARVRALLDQGASAETHWQESWFTAARWTAIRDSLVDRAASYRRLGPVRSLTRVSSDPARVAAGDAERDAATASYRVIYAEVTRIVTVGVDAVGHFSSDATRDE